MKKQIYIKKSLPELLFNFSIFVVLGILATQRNKIPVASRLYPSVILILSLLMNTIVTVITIKRYRYEENDLEITSFFRGTMKSLSFFIVIFIYINLIPKLGFNISTIAVMVILLLMLNVRSLPILIIFPVVMTFSIYFLFTYVLKVLLPAGIWL